MNTMMQIENLRKTYRQGSTAIDVLKGLDLRVERGESVAILGQSGSGKTTLLSLLAGLDAPDEGTIKVSGHELTILDERSLSQFRAKHLGIVFQQFHLMSNLTAIENVRLPLEIFRRKDAYEEAEAAIKMVGLEDRQSHLPNMLSGGERQRVAIARAFVVKPDVLLADEPSGNLDVETGQAVMNLIFDLVKQHHMTMILVTHNLELARRCDRTLQLRNGQLHTVS